MNLTVNCLASQLCGSLDKKLKMSILCLLYFIEISLKDVIWNPDCAVSIFFGNSRYLDAHVSVSH
uniref:Uncharacterized protein n=1 Tax=Rhizophora mucronata TaxID=61149 RepID=A0A2P2NL57_RHIMU